jgi:hypothetical protein
MAAGCAHGERMNQQKVVVVSSARVVTAVMMICWANKGDVEGEAEGEAEEEGQAKQASGCTNADRPVTT